MSLKMLVIGLDGADPQLLLGLETLENLRRLAEFGLYGSLDGPGSDAPWRSLASAFCGVSKSSIEPDAESILIRRRSAPGPLIVRKGSTFASFREALTHDGWTFAQFVDRSLSRMPPESHSGDELLDRYAAIDRELGGILEDLDDSTGVLVVSALESSRSAPGLFVLTSPGLSVTGKVEEVRVSDLVLTLLELTEVLVSPMMLGRSLLSTSGMVSMPEPPIDDEEIIRQRLSGLGYL